MDIPVDLKAEENFEVCIDKAEFFSINCVSCGKSLVTTIEVAQSLGHSINEIKCNECIKIVDN